MELPLKKNIIVMEKARPFWQVVLAALFYTITIAQLVFIVWDVYDGAGEKDFRQAVKSLNGVILTFILGVRFSIRGNFYFDISERRYKKEHSVGFIRFGKWEHLPDIEYVSVFRQAWSKDTDGNGRTDTAGYRYDVNIWHSTSKHFTIYSCDEVSPAFEMAKYIASRLGVDLLDATVPNDSKWVEINPTSQHQQPIV